MDDSFITVTLRELGNLELPPRICHSPKVPLIGQYAVLFKVYSPNSPPPPPPRAPSTLCVLFIRCFFVQNACSFRE